MIAIRARWSVNVLAAALLAGCSGCDTAPGKVWVYIDNAGNEPLVVKVDGQEAATIEPESFATLKYPPGEYRFCITRGSETLCDLTRKLEKSDKFGQTRMYLFNPDKLNLYQSYEVKYGGSRLDGVMTASLLSFQKDQKIRNQYIYKQLLKEIKLYGTDAWIDISGVEYVLSEPPETMLTRSGSSRRVNVLDRIERRDYERLTAAAKIESPTEADIDALNELIDEILDKAL